MQPQPDIALAPEAGTRHHGGWGHFAQHYVEMLLAMAAGMLIFGGAVRGVLALTGGELSMGRQPELASLEMAFDMSAGMLIWMRVRGHGWAGSLEMCAAMFAPLAVLLPLLWLDVVSTDSLMMFEHALMLPLMLLVMLRRRDEFAHRSPKVAR
ncbi:hypothetical protein E1200_07910 [Actinomadura sp. GC306]|uniref:hypothetical protein n=1 Tax=Actinomadura sp. GC306 TaxID=2530367 RepID=UPI0010513ADB|nr:hypothetical protein [Actinomadura sp. GC306]TDC69608.1 hypothetical protein E1200_07910 [Actinomadura sp. GC306]